MTRLWTDPNRGAIGIPISVLCQKPDPSDADLDDNLPKEFTWLGVDHQVVEITETWRVDMDWWRERIWRAYFKLRTDTGLLVIIYQDLVGGKWYLQRLYD